MSKFRFRFSLASLSIAVLFFAVAFAVEFYGRPEKPKTVSSGVVTNERTFGSISPNQAYGWLAMQGKGGKGLIAVVKPMNASIPRPIDLSDNYIFRKNEIKLGKDFVSLPESGARLFVHLDCSVVEISLDGDRQQRILATIVQRRPKHEDLEWLFMEANKTQLE